MRNKVIVAIGAILVALSCAGGAYAEHMITGEVIAVHPSWQSLTINVEGFPVTFTAIDQAVMALASLKPGDMVKVATDSFTADFSPSNYHAETADWMATAHYIVKLRPGGN